MSDEELYEMFKAWFLKTYGEPFKNGPTHSYDIGLHQGWMSSAKIFSARIEEYKDVLALAIEYMDEAIAMKKQMYEGYKPEEHAQWEFDQNLVRKARG